MTPIRVEGVACEEGQSSHWGMFLDRHWMQPQADGQGTQVLVCIMGSRTGQPITWGVLWESTAPGVLFNACIALCWHSLFRTLQSPQQQRDCTQKCRERLKPFFFLLFQTHIFVNLASPNSASESEVTEEP